ncbi:polyketide cyclase [Nonomuraea sp. WAC 01424]|uniref:SRPBCC family protein n=1 Tax=Nonomuraea sp. WAC 01424 TaxID=2203200 RepID=UPI000F79E2A9|nr:SRPBCC family protein [Nonomuraea sp. WAC 01424]RSM97041.1 polyketide cyclase [Nonomuraea sp. WAC 01424]
MDSLDEISRIRRELKDGERKTVVLTRHYDAEVKDVWDACTDAERLARWFLPVSGDLRLGGTYQLEGNAGGEILDCEPPAYLRVSWLFGPDPGFSEVEVRLSAEDEGTLFELRHTAEVPPEMWGRYGPGAVGVGWDLALLGLGLHLAGGPPPDKSGFELTGDGRRFITASSQAWGAAFERAGAAPETAVAAVAGTTAFYLPPEDQA